MSNEEAQRLQSLYQAMDDMELIRLSEQATDLTETAQQALRAELDARSLSVAAPEEEDHSFIAADQENMVVVLELTDLSRAQTIRDLLEDHELTVAIRAFNLPSGDGYYWMLSVPEPQHARAAALLQANKRLVPQAEIIEPDPDFMPGEEDCFLVAEFEDARDAHTARMALHAEAIAFREYELAREDHPVWTFEVAQNDVERAGEALERALQAIPQEDAAL